MKIIEPKIELIEQGEDIVSHVACCARVCYKREKGNDEVTYNNLLKNKHWSMFRHSTSYHIIDDYRINLSDPTFDLRWIEQFNIAINKYKQLIVGIDVKYYNHIYYVVINGNWALDHQDLVSTIMDYKVEDEVFANSCFMAWNMMRYTFKITTQISTSRELNRVSPNNIAEQSTRYVYEDGTICRPHWMTEEEADILNNISDNTCISKVKHLHYINSTKSSFDRYKLLIENDMLRQDARGVLPLDTATEVVYTYSWSEWADIIRKRVYHTTGKAHPNCVVVCKMIEKELNKLGYDIKL